MVQNIDDVLQRGESLSSETTNIIYNSLHLYDACRVMNLYFQMHTAFN